MTTCFIATGNAHKVGEIQSLLGGGFTLLSRRDVPSPLDPEETGSTFEENARIKALAWARHLTVHPGPVRIDWVLADDSGLEVDALHGAPGIHSARFAALDDGRPGNSPDAGNNAKLLRLMETVPEGRRQARFRCVLALTPVDPSASPAELAERTRCFQGHCPGHISAAAAGSHGFGYDPLFVPEGHSVSFAELGDEIKGRISHRARAFEGLREFLVERKASNHQPCP